MSRKIYLAVALFAALAAAFIVVANAEESDAATAKTWTVGTEVHQSLMPGSSYSVSPGNIPGISFRIAYISAQMPEAIAADGTPTTPGTWTVFAFNSSSQIIGSMEITVNAPSLTINTSTDGHGTATGGGTYSVGSTCTLTAAANSGYSFDKWTLNGSSFSTTNPLPINITQVVANTYYPSITFTANFTSTPQNYTHDLYYNANGGSGAPSTQSKTTTTSTSYTFTISSSTPTRSGYNFLGWSTSSSATTASYQPGGSISVSANGYKTLYAVWQEIPSSYSVTVYLGNYSYFYWYNGSDTTHYSSTHTYTVTAGSSFDIDWKGNSQSTSGTNPVVTKTYTNCNNMVTSSGYPGGGSDKLTINSNTSVYPADEMTYTTSNTYHFTIKYNANGGSGAPSDTTATNSSSTKSITLSSTTPTRSGYTFLGWSTSSTATSASYSAGTSYSFSYGTTNLYAVWELEKLTVNVMTSLGEGTVSGGGTYSVGQSFTLSATPGTGYTFKGWSVQSQSTPSIFTNPYTVTVTQEMVNAGTYTYRAYFTDVCDISFSATPNGYGDVDTVKLTGIKYGTAFTVSSNKIIFSTQAGNMTATATPAEDTAQYDYAFDGWYVNNTKISSGTVSSNMDIVAKFFRAEYFTHTIHYEPGGGSGTMTDSVLTNYDSGLFLVELKSNSFTKTGYRFTGWLVDGWVLQPGDTITVEGNAEKTATAQWSLITYDHKITYAANGGSGSMGDTSVTDNSSGNSNVTLSQCTFTKTGYHFSGWSVNGTVKQPGDTVSVAGNATVTATAQWTANALTIGSIEKQYAVAGKTTSFAATAASDPSGATITYTSSNASSGLTVSINGSTVTLSSSLVGTYTFTLTASAANYTSSSTTVTVQFVPVLEFTNSPSVGIIGE